MMRSRPPLSLFGLVAMVCMLCSTAEAQSPPPEDRSAHLISEAAAAYSAGRFDDAVTGYLAVYEVTRNPQVLLILAHIHDRALGDDKGAIAYYRMYLSTNPSDAADVTAELEAAVQRGTAGRPTQAQLKLTTEPANGVALSVDGTSAGVTPVEALVRPPGEMQLKLQKDGFAEKMVTLQLTPGANSAHVALDSIVAEDDTNTAAWAVGGFTAGAAVGWGTTAVIAQLEQDRKVALASDVLLSVAVAGAIATVVLWVVD